VRAEKSKGISEDYELQREYGKRFAEKERKRTEIDTKIRERLTRLLKKGETLIPS
jgi:hypothetical protein